MAVLNMTHTGWNPWNSLDVSGPFSRGAYQEACPVALRVGTCGHLGRERESTPGASASGSDHSWHSSPASSQVGAGQWSGANGHLPSLSIELIVLSRGTGALG